MSRQQKGQKRKKENVGPSIAPSAFLDAVNGYNNTNRDSGKRTTFETVVDTAVHAGLVSRGKLSTQFGIKARKASEFKAIPEETRAAFIEQMTERANDNLALS